MEVYENPTPVAYRDIIEDLADRPEDGSRVGGMREELSVTIRSEDPRHRWMTRRKFNLPFALQETFAYWRGLNPGHVQRYNSNMETWLDDDGRLPGSAYGERMRETAGHDQLARVEEQLRESPQSRRAVVQVHQAHEEDYDGGDVACTNHLHFFVRGGDLHCHASIRSQDMFWGFPYDAQNNQAIQEMLAGRLGLGLGEYVHTMESCHYYTDMEDRVLDSLDEHESWRTRDSRLDAEGHDRAMDLLAVGLEAARDGSTPEDVWTSLRDLWAVHYADWLAVMVSYEQSRFHGDDLTARRWRQRVHDGHFRDWLERYLEGEQF